MRRSLSRPGPLLLAVTVLVAAPLQARVAVPQVPARSSLEAARAHLFAGRYDEALANIRGAFAAFPDPEVASHMGEILWAMGRREEALAVWERALEEAPNDPLVTEAMERLQKQAPQTDEQEDAA